LEVVRNTKNRKRHKSRTAPGIAAKSASLKKPKKELFIAEHLLSHNFGLENQSG
jgi:hypothetical protein